MSGDAAWIEALESKVEQAVEEIRRLRAENQGLRENMDAAGRAPDDEEAVAWKEERERVKARVEGIVERLEELLGT